jgi:hypothetical protein
MYVPGEEASSFVLHAKRCHHFQGEHPSCAKPHIGIEKVLQKVQIQFSSACQ